jgi:hypothetical protein
MVNRSIPLSLALAASLAGCFVTSDDFDQDRDGFRAVEAGGDDCDDRNPNIYPGAPEVCGNGFDDNCDGLVDRVYAADGSGSPARAAGQSVRVAEGTLFFLDEDRDGYGRDDEYLEECAIGGVVIGARHFVAPPGDCDDTDPTVNPGVIDDDCDGVDSNCDGTPDSEVDPATRWWPDRDADTWGDDSNPARARYGCPPTDDPQIPIWARRGGDCDDLNPEINPGMAEQCDGVDNDCSGRADDAVLGEGPECPGASCVDVHATRPESGSGTFWVGPRGQAVRAQCEASGSFGRGWTAITLPWMKESGLGGFRDMWRSGQGSWQKRGGADVARLTVRGHVSGDWVQANVELPFTFREIRGSWTVEGYSPSPGTPHRTNDHWSPPPRFEFATSSSNGNVLFGTAARFIASPPNTDDIKTSGWGLDWPCGGFTPGGCSSAFFTPRSYSIPSVATVSDDSQIIRWEFHHVHPDSPIDLTDVQLFVR